MADRPTTATCEWCGDEFTVPADRGPTPRYCSHAHRQRAYEKRERDQAAAAHSLTDLELRALEASAELANLMYQVVTQPTPSGQLGQVPDADDALAAQDWNEIAVLIHGIQARIGAQAAARAHPTLYRLSGRRLP